MLGGACAEGAALDDDDGDDQPTRRTPVDGGEDAKAPRSDAGGSSSGGSSGASSSGGEDAGPDAGPLTACQQALASILFDVETSTAPEKGTSWSVGTLDGQVQTDTSWPFQPFNFSSSPAAVIPTKCANDNCVGTSLSRNYAQCQRGWIATPEADLTACIGEDVVVKFDHAYAFNVYGSDHDGGLVEYTGNGADFNTATWSLLDAADMTGNVNIRGVLTSSYKCLADSTFYVNGKRGYIGVHPATQTTEIALPPDALTAHARLRFLFSSGVAFETTNADESRTHTSFGWRIDNVRFEQKL